MSESPSCKDWLPKLRKEFGSLWDCSLAGQSLRIQTPFSTPTNKLVSIFIHQRGEEFIVTDGGWLSDLDNSYEFHAFEDDEQENAVLDFLADRYDVKQTFNGDGQRIFYKKTNDPALVASRAFDVAAFVAAYVTGMHLSLPLTPAPRQAIPRFRTRASDYLKSVRSDIKLNEHLPGIARYTYHAVRYANSNPVSVVTYVSGSNRVNFSNELSSALLRARLLQRASYYHHIKTMVTLYDDECGGYHAGEFNQVFDILAEVSTRPPVSWTDRKELVDIV